VDVLSAFSVFVLLTKCNLPCFHSSGSRLAQPLILIFFKKHTLQKTLSQKTYKTKSREIDPDGSNMSKDWISTQNTKKVTGNEDDWEKDPGAHQEHGG
jgi:hypothetical protein